ncbi:hypothetical protein H8E77_27135 [bacterium]|nr:hypothetical protein [bacterium]
MINTKQQELIHELLEMVRQRFPEVKLLSVTESPENFNDLWINVSAPEDEDREIELMEFTSDKEADILVDYGYRIAVMPTKVIAA